MRLVFFTRQDCSACTSAKKKIGFFLGKWGLTDSVEIEEFDVGCEDGLVEAAMQGVGEIPTIVLWEDEQELRRWVKTPPVSRELMRLLGVEA